MKLIWKIWYIHSLYLEKPNHTLEDIYLKIKVQLLLVLIWLPLIFVQKDLNGYVIRLFVMSWVLHFSDQLLTSVEGIHCSTIKEQLNVQVTGCQNPNIYGNVQASNVISIAQVSWSLLL